MQCKKCNGSFPCKVMIDGKQRVLSNRKYCLTCSPFGQHNTKAIEFPTSQKNCKRCNKVMNQQNSKGTLCWVCVNKKSREEKIEKLKAIVGDACWKCGYDKLWAALDFHHVDPEIKSFQLTVRELQFSWDRIYTEVQKCVLLCCRCHREHHNGLISDDEIKELYEVGWQKISGRKHSGCAPRS